ncbi:DUF2267 domain-containing protein [Myxococcus sp. K15C18031901]|uniref:DUF2267 domain-containing protein n=1 Tax=Myxococcus dinghuensis TaxID=2906761 RepID=UPI0020A7FE48|nr:DUF2267 domain-containing protein [Myxococcus dinghuensis]MCP3098191.1 DUF2267 domain-containing protein [Myxococcus dinghuensis]
MADQREPQGTHSHQEGSIEERRARRRAAHASQTYAAFIKRLCDRGGMSPAVAQQAAVSVLCAVEQRINSDETRDLEAQLPNKLADLLHRCERHEDELPGKFGREDLLRRVGEDLALNPDAVEPVVRAVLNSIRDLISEGEAEDVMSQLPEDLRELWRHPV